MRGGVNFDRRKPRRLWLSLAYRLRPILRLLPARTRLALLLNSNWLFRRLAHDESHRYFADTTHPAWKSSQDFLAKHLEPEHTVLDLGCGNGRLSKWIAGIVASVVGVDHEAGHRDGAWARDRPDNLEFHVGDVRDYLAAHDARFSVLVLSHVLEHIDDPREFLSSLVDRFDHAFIEVPDFEASSLNLIRRTAGFELAWTDQDHVVEFGRDEIEELLSSVGLEILELERIHNVQRFWCAVATDASAGDD